MFSTVYVALQANMCNIPNTVSMLAQRLRRWPAIETSLGFCLDCYAGDALLLR